MGICSPGNVHFDPEAAKVSTIRARGFKKVKEGWLQGDFFGTEPSLNQVASAKYFYGLV